MDIKGFLKDHKVKIGVVAGFVVVVAIGLFVGDITLIDVMKCVGSFDVGSPECLALNT